MSPNKKSQLSDLYLSIEKMAGQLPLAKTPQEIVWGEGCESAKVLFVGEAPGAKETELRKPFVGRSGQLFRKLLKESNLDPKNYYITNIVKSRPEQNRDPKPWEVLAYKVFLDQEIKILKPILIVTLGRISLNNFLKNVSISQVHGQLFSIQYHLPATMLASMMAPMQASMMPKNSTSTFNTHLIPLFHPAYALRSTRIKEIFKEDLFQVPKHLKEIRKKT
jgi:uracil-DNA glycosylase